MPTATPGGRGGVVSIPLGFAVGTVGNLAGTSIAGTDVVWDVTLAEGLYIVLGTS